MRVTIRQQAALWKPLQPATALSKGKRLIIIDLRT